MKMKIDILSNHLPDVIITIYTIQMIQIIVYVTLGIYLFLNDVKNEIEILGRLVDLMIIDESFTYYMGKIVFISRVAYDTKKTSLWTNSAKFIATVIIVGWYIWHKNMGRDPSHHSRSKRMYLHVLYFTYLGFWRLLTITLGKTILSKNKNPSKNLMEIV